MRVCGIVGTQHYALSQDGTEVAFSMRDKMTGQSKLWIAPTDRRSSPSGIESSASEDCPFFLPNGDLVFRTTEGKQNFLYRMRTDGTERRKISDIPILDSECVSHGGRWVLAITRGCGDDRPYFLAAFPTNGGPPVSVCQGLCQATWDRTGKWLYITRLRGDPIYSRLCSTRAFPVFPPMAHRPLRNWPK
jgi:hypothetical protein